MLPPVVGLDQGIKKFQEGQTMYQSCEEYLALVSKNQSLNTAGAYERDLRAFSDYFVAQNKSDPALLLPEEIDAYLDDISRTMTASSVCRRLSVIRGFYKHLYASGGCNRNPAAELKSRNKAEEKKEMEILNQKEVELLLNQPDPQDPKGRRDKAMLELLYATGMRVSEMLDLVVENLNLKTGLVICECGKRSRAIPLYPLAVKCLGEYLEFARPRFVEKNPGCDYLFVNVSGDRMTRQGFWKLLKEYAAKAGISTGISPHTLRHSFALHLLENGADAKEVQTIMGNADAATIKGYVRYARSRLNDQAMGHHPHAQKKGS